MFAKLYPLGNEIIEGAIFSNCDVKLARIIFAGSGKYDEGTLFGEKILDVRIATQWRRQYASN